MLISSAHAQAAGAAPQGAFFGPDLLLIALIFAVFYFLVLRPQNRRMREHAEMTAGLRRGDRVITNGGMYGEITKVVDDRTVELRIAEGVVVCLERSAVAALVDKGQPADSADKDTADKSGKGKKAKKSS